MPLVKSDEFLQSRKFTEKSAPQLIYSTARCHAERADEFDSDARGPGSDTVDRERARHVVQMGGECESPYEAPAAQRVALPAAKQANILMKIIAIS